MRGEYLSELQHATWIAFLKAYASLIDRIDQDLKQAGGVPIASFEVLSTLSEIPAHQLPLDELSRGLRLTGGGAIYLADHAAVVRLVESLVAAGYLELSAAHRSDQGEIVTLTEQGMTMVQRTWPIYEQRVERYFAQWMNEVQTTHFKHSLVSMLEASSAHPPNG